jgi:hypothetical protein
MSSAQRQSGPWARLSAFLAIIALGLAAALFVVTRANDSQQASAPPTVAALRTEVAQLQETIAAQRTPGRQASGSQGYIATVQIDKYSYVLYFEWTESDGFVRDGRLFTTDNYARNASKVLQITGTDNRGSYGFTGHDQGTTFTFTGKANADGTFTVTSVPWSVFYGFVGGTFTQTLHPATRDDYDAAVRAMPGPPS